MTYYPFNASLTEIQLVQVYCTNRTLKVQGGNRRARATRADPAQRLLDASPDLGDAISATGKGGVAQVAIEEGVIPRVALDAARRGQTLSFKLRIDEHVEVLDVLASHNLVPTCSAGHPVVPRRIGDCF